MLSDTFMMIIFSTFHQIARLIFCMQYLPLETLLINLLCHFSKSLRLQTVDNNFEKFVGQRFFKFTYKKIKSIYRIGIIFYT